MNLLSIFKRKEPQGEMTTKIRNDEARKILLELLASGKEIDGIIAIVSIERVPRILVGGIDNAYEAQGLLADAIQEIHEKGVPIYD